MRHDQDSISTALYAIRQGYQPVPIRKGGKRPFGEAWQHTRWDRGADESEVRAFYEDMAERGAPGVGVLLGKPSSGLLDVDMDHPIALRLRDYFLPPTPMESGRAGRPRSHRWYIVEDMDEIPASRQYKMPDGSVSIELRSTGGQTVLPPTIHPSGEEYRWESEPWGGDEGPTVINGRVLAIQVALVGMASVLVQNWPHAGGRHEAYLHLAGGLLRYGEGVHEYWERNLPVLISAMADVTHDDDGPDVRVKEVMGTTLTKLREGGKVSGLPKLGEVIGADHAEQVRRLAKEVESLSGYTPEVMTRSIEGSSVEISESYHTEEIVSTLPPEERNPMEERINSWAAVDIEPYLTGQVVMPEPNILRREDGKGLFYPGRVNSLYGKSESAKSWIALYSCVQEMAHGDRVMYLDLEDEPAGTLARVKALGGSDEDIQNYFRYVHPEGPIASMQRYKFGAKPSDEGRQGEAVFGALLDAFDPTLIVVDGMTVLYGLHGHDTNEATATDVITSWLKSLCRGGRTTVIVIDHTGKGGGAGASPIGAHHKVAMVQGTALRADAINRPMPGQVGNINLVVFKDRPGAVRAISTMNGQEQIAALIEMDSTVPDVTKVKVQVPDADTVVIGNSDAMEAKLESLARVEENSKKILELFGGDLDKEINTPTAAKEADIPVHEVYDVWTHLTNKGVLVKLGATRWTRFKLAQPETTGDEKK